MKAIPKVGDQGFAVHRGFRFLARVMNVVTGRKGPSLVVTAVHDADWRRLPAASVCVEPRDFASLCSNRATFEDVGLSARGDDLLRCGHCGALVTFDEIEHASGVSNAVAAAGGGA